jgi:hypothetical protein
VLTSGWHLQAHPEMHDTVHELTTGPAAGGTSGSGSAPIGALRTRARTDGTRIAEWDGITLRSTLVPETAARRDRLADAARDGDWRTVSSILDTAPAWANSARLEGCRGYTPLHQAAWHGAKVETVERLLSFGARRTLRTSGGDRPIDIAA